MAYDQTYRLPGGLSIRVTRNDRDLYEAGFVPDTGLSYKADRVHEAIGRLVILHDRQETVREQKEARVIAGVAAGHQPEAAADRVGDVPRPGVTEATGVDQEG